MFEGGVLPRDPAGGAVRTLNAPAQDASTGAVACAEDVADLLGFLVAGGELVGVVEGLLARLLATIQNPNNDRGPNAGGGGSGDSEGLFAGESSTGAVLVATAERHRVMFVEEIDASGVMDLGAWDLDELVAVCHRLAAWASWGQSLAVACLAACSRLLIHPDQWDPDGRVSSAVDYEECRFSTTCLLSARLGVSRSRAGQIVDHGIALMGMGFNPVEAMERCGILDAPKVSLVARRLKGVSAPAALTIQERVLPQVSGRSVFQVGRDIERVLMEADPIGHAEQARVNQGHRCVTHLRPVGEGPSQVRLLLPTMDVLLLDATLDTIAASVRAAGEQRTPTQLRADTITTMTPSTLRTNQQTTCYRPAQAPDNDTQDATPTRPHGDDSGTDDDNLGDTLGGTGGRVISGGLAGRLSDSTGGDDVTEGFGDDLGGVSEPTASLVPPRRSASLGRLLPDGMLLEGLLSSSNSLAGSASLWWIPPDTGHLPPLEDIHVNVQVAVPLTSLANLVPPGDPTDKDDPRGGEYSEGPHYSKFGRASLDQNPTITTSLNGVAPQGNGWSLPITSSGSLSTTGGWSLPGSSGWSLPEPDPTTPAPQLAASLSVALISQATASLCAADGVVQVWVRVCSVAMPALTVQALATGRTWRHLVTDPAGGTVVDIDHTGYRPPAGLADLIHTRDRACAFPTRQTPAGRRDIGYLAAWGRGGTTNLDNLATLCQAHHRFKHAPGQTLTRDQAIGTLSWRTLDKTVYQRHPDGTITCLPHKTGLHQHYTPITVIPGYLSQQISPDVIDCLNRALDTAPDNQVCNHTSPGTNASTNASGSGRTRLEVCDPQPDCKPGDYETTPYPQATHTLQFTSLIDQIPPFQRSRRYQYMTGHRRYAELHAHSAYSFLDGVNEPDDPVSIVVEFGLGVLAPTDHDGAPGIVKHARVDCAHGLPIIRDIEPTSADSSHLPVLTRNPTGCRRLMSAISRHNLGAGQCQEPVHGPPTLAPAFRSDPAGQTEAAAGTCLVLTGTANGPLRRALGGPCRPDTWNSKAAGTCLRHLTELFAAPDRSRSTNTTAGDTQVEGNAAASLTVEFILDGSSTGAAFTDALIRLAYTYRLPLVTTGAIRYAHPTDARLADVPTSTCLVTDLEDTHGHLPSTDHWL